MSKSSAALGSLRLSLDVSDQYGKDSSEGILVPENFEEVTININEDGNWQKSSKTLSSPCKKDVTARADELEFYENAVVNLKNIAANADQKLLDTITSINEKKEKILLTIDNAIISGCASTTVGVASVFVNGETVFLGITSDVVTDYAYINEYTQLSGNGENPFKDESQNTLTQSNLGDGYETGYTVNGGGFIGSFRQLTGNLISIPPAPPVPSNGCLDAIGIVSSLAAEISDLRSSIDNQLITDTNAVKDEKTEYELFAWSYKSTDQRVANKKAQTQNVISIIDNQSAFG